MNMPKKNGIQVLEEIKADERLKHIPVVMLTSSTSEKDVKESYGAGAASYVAKPTSIEDHKKLLAAFDMFWFEVAILPN
jgi:CheY-like chemotaxis protein